jgi:hypothetical protein
MNNIPEGYFEGDHRRALATHFDPIEDVFEHAPESQFLKAVKYAREVDQDYAARIGQIRAGSKTLEEELINSQPGFEERMSVLISRDPGAAKKAITEYCESQLQRAAQMMR